MVYKISGEFTDENLPQFIDKLKSKYNILYRNGNFYIALKSYKDSVSFDDLNDLLTIQSPYDLAKQLKQKLQQEVFLPIEDFWIKDLFSNFQNYQNNSKENGYVKKWIEDNLIRIDIERLEIEQQAKLREVWSSLDEIEQALDDKIQEIFHKNKNNKGNNNEKRINEDDND